MNKPQGKQQECLLFLCEQHNSIPEIAYEIKENDVYLTLKCQYPQKHKENIKYSEYLNKLSKPKPLSNFHCHKHSSEPSVRYCAKHEEHLCFFCFKNHLSTFPNDIWLQELSIDLKYYCNKHKNNEHYYFCKVCSMNFCEDCLEQHKGHNFLNWRLNNNTEKINKFKDNIDKLEQDYFIALSNTYQDSCKDWKSKNENNIEQLMQSTNDRINDEKENYEKQINELKNICENKIEEINISKDSEWIRLESSYKSDIQELDKAYERNIKINKDLFDIIKHNISMYDSYKSSYNYNWIKNINMIINHINIARFDSQENSIDKGWEYLKTNIVIDVNKWNSSKHLWSDTNYNPYKWVQGNKLENHRIWSICKWTNYSFAVSYRFPKCYIHIVDVSKLPVYTQFGDNLHNNGVYRLYLHSKTQYWISLGWDNVIGVWNYTSQKWVAKLTGHSDQLRDVVELPDGNIVTVGDDKN